MTFEAVDVEATPAARQTLAGLGVPAVPAVVVGERAVHGWNPKAVAELVGVPYAGGPALPPAEPARQLGGRCARSRPSTSA